MMHFVAKRNKILRKNYQVRNYVEPAKSFTLYVDHYLYILFVQKKDNSIWLSKTLLIDVSIMNFLLIHFVSHR